MNEFLIQYLYFKLKITNNFSIQFTSINKYYNFTLKIIKQYLLGECIQVYSNNCFVSDEDT